MKNTLPGMLSAERSCEPPKIKWNGREQRSERRRRGKRRSGKGEMRKGKRKERMEKIGDKSRQREE
jgi:hypothetical protein